jgi:hypothetical protein
MRNLIRSVSFMVAIVCASVLTVSAAHAQTIHSVSVTVPFDFSVGKMSFKAGAYTVQATASGILVFTSNDELSRRFVSSDFDAFSNTSRQPHFVFIRYGSETFLREVFLSSNNDCNRLPVSKREKEVAQRYVSGQELSLLTDPVR